MANFSRVVFKPDYYKKGIKQRRRNARIPVNIEGTIELTDSYENLIVEKCIINSLSTGGVSFLANLVLIKGDNLTIEFRLKGNIINSDIKITRIIGKEVGSRFVKFENKGKKIIQEYIYNRVFAKK